ncbi:MAG TPA: peptidase U62 [Tissierellia bacterium]|nr:peptidase U62 [Tissierellia bacterium]
MIKEKYTNRVKEISVNIVQTDIDSVRKKDILKTGLRVYDKGYIGVAGAMGKADEEDLERRAIDNLSLKIPYPCEPSENLKMHLDYREDIFSDEEFVREADEVLKVLRDEFSDFTFSNKMYLFEMETGLTNDLGLDLLHRDRLLTVEFVIKEKASANVFDAFAIYATRQYNREELLNIIREELTAYRNPVKLPEEGKLPVVFMDFDMVPVSKLIDELNGYKLGTGASLFKDFIGEKKFNENFTFYQSAEKEDLRFIEFFDAEGVVNEGFKYALIENGRIMSPYTDKKTAHKFNLPLTGSAVGEYDKVPSLSPRYFKVKSSDKTLKELLNGKMAVAVVIASGGDFTAEGVFGTPVQLAFLTDGERLIGRLPELKLSGELYSMFGEDFIGKSKDKAFLGQQALALYLNVNYL